MTTPEAATCPHCGADVALLPDLKYGGVYYADHEFSDEGLQKRCPRAFTRWYADDLDPIERDEKGRVIR